MRSRGVIVLSAALAASWPAPASCQGRARPDEPPSSPSPGRAAHVSQLPTAPSAENVTVVPDTGRTADVEDVAGHAWRLRGIRLDFSGSFREPGPDRFQSVKRSREPGDQPLILRVGSTDLLIPLDALVSMEKAGDRTVEVVYDWNGARQTVKGDLGLPESSYERYDLEGISTTHGTTVRIALLDVKSLVLDASSRSSGERFRLPALDATIHLKGGGAVRVADLARVLQGTGTCYHDRELTVSSGKGKITVPFALLASFDFIEPRDELRLVYRDAPPETVTLWQGDVFDNRFAGLTGFSEIGEVFVRTGDIASVELAGGSQ